MAIRAVGLNFSLGYHIDQSQDCTYIHFRYIYMYIYIYIYMKLKEDKWHFLLSWYKHETMSVCQYWAE